MKDQCPVCGKALYGYDKDWATISYQIQAHLAYHQLEMMGTQTIPPIKFKSGGAKS